MMQMTIIRSFTTIPTKAALIILNSIPIEMRTQKLATLSKLKRQATNLKDTTATIVNNILNQCSINPELLDHHCSSPQQQEPNPAN